MKRTYIITLLLSLCSLFTYAQESFFDKYADMEGVTSVYISKAMLSLMPDMKTEEIYIGELASKLDNIQILNCEKASVTAQIKKDISYIIINQCIIPTICVKHDLYLSLFKHFCRKKIRKYVPKRSLKTFPKQ